MRASVHIADEHLPAGAENPWTTWKETQSAEYTVWPVGSEHVKVGIYSKKHKLVIMASSKPCIIYTSLPHDEQRGAVV